MHSMAFSDTSPEAEAIQLAIYRRMSAAQRIATAFELSVFTRELALAGIQRDHPDWPRSEVFKEFLRRQFPADQIPEPLR